MHTELLTQIILKINAMKKHLERQSKDAYEVNQENGEWFPVFEKTKTIDEIIKEEEFIKITAPHRFEELDIKTLLRNERSVMPPDFYNKRKKK